MLGLAQFDTLLSHQPAARRAAAAPAAKAGPASLPSHLLLDPWGEPVAEFFHTPTPGELLRAAHRLTPADCCVAVADEARSSSCARPAWRLALLRPSAALQWLSPAVVARPGTPPARLRGDLQAAALRELWRQGWRVQA